MTARGWRSIKDSWTRILFSFRAPILRAFLAVEARGDQAFQFAVHYMRRLIMDMHLPGFLTDDKLDVADYSAADLITEMRA